MESFFRRRFFVFHLLCLAVAAFLCARAVNVVVDHQLLKLVAAQTAPAATKPRPPPPPPSRDFAAANEQNIFDGRRENLVENAAALAEAAKPAGPTGSWESAVLTALKVRLVGTAVFEEDEFSIASIVDESKGASATASMYSINECVAIPTDPNDPNSKLVGKAAPCNRLAESGIIKRIEPERVYFWNETEGRYEYISIDDKPIAGKPAAVAKKEAPAGDADLGKDIKKTGENTYEVGQSEVDKALNNLASLATEARIVPAFEGGKSVGFKLFSIRPGSLYSKIGLQNGDVINRINGYEITSPDKALEVYGKLKDSKHVTVDVKRRGKPTTLDYTITP